jgi:hypothetical protein
MLDRHFQGVFDLVARCASISGLRLEAVDRTTHKFMYKLTESERAKRQGLLRQFDGSPAETVLPDESEWVAQQSLERCGGMDARQRAFNGRMFRSDRTIMRGEFSPRTTTPAGSAGRDKCRLPRLLGPREEPIALAERMLRNSSTISYQRLQFTRP